MTCLGCGNPNVAPATTKILYFTNRSVTPFMSTINKRIGEIRLIDFKNLFDRPGFFRFHFKAVDQEFGMVKEEVSSPNTNSSQTEYTAILYCWNVVSIRAIRGYKRPRIKIILKYANSPTLEMYWPLE